MAAFDSASKIQYVIWIWKLYFLCSMFVCVFFFVFLLVSCFGSDTMLSCNRRIFDLYRKKKWETNKFYPSIFTFKSVECVMHNRDKQSKIYIDGNVAFIFQTNEIKWKIAIKPKSGRGIIVSFFENCLNPHSSAVTSSAMSTKTTSYLTKMLTSINHIALNNSNETEMNNRRETNSQ